MTARKDNDFLNGVPELLLLRLLARQPMHGYELVQVIKLTTDSTLAFGEGSIYPVLHRMEADGVTVGTRRTNGVGWCTAWREETTKNRASRKIFRLYLTTVRDSVQMLSAG